MTGFLPGLIRRLAASWIERAPRSLAIALDMLPADLESAAQIRADQISAIVRLTPVAMAASCFNALVLLATFWAMGELHWLYWIWAALIFALAGYYLRGWNRSRSFQGPRSGSRRAIRRTVLNGFLFGSFWGVVPAVVFPGASPPVQLFIAVLTSGMMFAGGFVLATVPLAGAAYVAVVAAGSLYALLQQPSPLHLGLAALTVAYMAVLVASIGWSASLFVSSRLAEAQVREEILAREAAQMRVAQSERMSALGELAGGIAHDFNNILQVVGAGAQLIGRHPEDGAAVSGYAGQIGTAVERGAAITRRLLGFARQDLLRPEDIEPTELIGEVRELLARTIDASIEIRTDVAAGASAFMADRFRLETVLLNLATNARDAMPGGGSLTISAADSAEREAGAPQDARRYVRIAVTDTGAGMDETTLARAGQPFFTTKPKGKGTGLGLSMAKGFAEQSGGAFQVVSALGRGTTVTLWLPQGHVAQAAPIVAEVAAPPAPARQPRVMLVDDDDAVRATLARSLQDAGFAVVSCEGAERALGELRLGLEIDVLITDLSMPGMNGWDLVRELRSQRPLTPSVMLTGNLEDADAEAQARVEDKRFVLLRKPIAPSLLARRVTALLGAEAAAAAGTQTGVASAAGQQRSAS